MEFVESINLSKGYFIKDGDSVISKGSIDLIDRITNIFKSKIQKQVNKHITNSKIRKNVF